MDDDYHDINSKNMMSVGVDGNSVRQSRRSSLDHEKTIPITFLADYSNSQTSVKVDLDQDNHTNHSKGSRGGSSMKRSPNQIKKNSVTQELPAVTESLPLTETEIIVTNNNSIHSDQDDGDDFDDEDSFCEATGQESGNRAYIEQELGASDYFNDEEFFNHHVKPHVVTDDDAASIDEIIEEEVIMETILPPASTNKSSHEVKPVLISTATDDDDDDSDCDSFCDAKGSDAADQKYLEKDLGASCYWECPTLAGAAKAAQQLETSDKASKNNSNVDTIGEGDEEDEDDE
jgi:hypothetical protein